MNATHGEVETTHKWRVDFDKGQRVYTHGWFAPPDGRDGTDAGWYELSHATTTCIFGGADDGSDYVEHELFGWRLFKNGKRASQYTTSIPGTHNVPLEDLDLKVEAMS